MSLSERYPPQLRAVLLPGEDVRAGFLEEVFALIVAEVALPYVCEGVVDAEVAGPGPEDAAGGLTSVAVHIGARGGLQVAGESSVGLFFQLYPYDSS